MAAELQDPSEHPLATKRLRVTVSDEPDVLVIHPHGDIDMASAPVLRDCLTTATNECSEPIVIDLGAVTFMDSTGLDVLLHGQRALATKGLPLRVRNVPPNVRQVFDITGTGPLFDLDA